MRSSALLARVLPLVVLGAAFFGPPMCSGKARPAVEAARPNVPSGPPVALLDEGFRDLYTLNFQAARAKFQDYQQAQPGDALGKSAEAASYLYEEFNAKGVFTSAFFLNDSKLLNGVSGSPSQNRNREFLVINQQAREMAKSRLEQDPNDVQALFAITIADGMESDYDAFIEKKQIASLGFMRQAEAEANRLLAIDPSAQDAYVALGASNYVIGCLPAYKRVFLRIGGIHGDRAHGMQLMQIAAEHGHYLQPFAKILLALACEREHQMLRARALLTDLTREFPENPLFAQELAFAERDSASTR